MKKILFICGKNKLRSPTAEQIFADCVDIETDSAGINLDAETVLTNEQLAWADIIFVMESSQRKKLSDKYAKHLRNKKIVCLDIPDQFAYMDSNLIQLLNTKVRPYLPRG